MKLVYETANTRLQTILSRLKGVKKVGPNTYRAYSPLRDEKEPSLYITEKADGTILMCDHGGGDTKAIKQSRTPRNSFATKRVLKSTAWV